MINHEYFNKKSNLSDESQNSKIRSKQNQEIQNLQALKLGQILQVFSIFFQNKEVCFIV